MKPTKKLVGREREAMEKKSRKHDSETGGRSGDYLIAGGLQLASRQLSGLF
jgi:hypothetical protein